MSVCGGEFWNCEECVWGRVGGIVKSVFRVGFVEL